MPIIEKVQIPGWLEFSQGLAATHHYSLRFRAGNFAMTRDAGLGSQGGSWANK